VSFIGLDAGNAGESTMAGVFDAHVDGVYGYLARRVGADLAQDLTAEVFRIAVEHSAQFDPTRAGHRAWLLGIATNVVRRHWRTEERRLRAIARLGNQVVVTCDASAEVVAQLDAVADLARVLSAVATLDVEDRDLLLLVVWEQLSFSEVGLVLGIPAGTVKSRLHRIRSRLRSKESS
jgi:RNA polymerase sigma factor (sigma-70 family)